MNGSARCSKCDALTSDWSFIEGRYWCDEHTTDGRLVRAALARSKTMMGNKNAAKRSGNPAKAVRS